MQEKVVITGIGAVSPLGLAAEESWQNAMNGVSGIGPITLFDPSYLSVSIAGEVKNFNPEHYMPSREARRQDRYQQLAVAAVGEALRQSGLEAAGSDADRIGVMISSAIGGISSLEEAVVTLNNQGSRRIGPFVIPMMMANGAAGLVAIQYGFKGPAYCLVSACASGADGIGLAWLLIRAGIIDAAVAGASEATVCPVGVATFDRVGAMTKRTEFVPQPFDKERDGLVMGEGAGILILEKESRAKARGAPILAELASHAATGDAFHITAPSETGDGGARAISQALKIAGVNPEEVDYINAHGTGTDLNDEMETKAIKSAFGAAAYTIPVSSTKSMTGHMMGATGALEAVFCVQAIRDGSIPPTINYRTPDPDCDLDYVPNQGRQKRVRVAMSNAFGFGGHNAVLVIREYTG